MNKPARFKMRTLCSRPFAVASLAIGALTLSALQTQGADFTQTNLVSNIDGLAKITDLKLKNPSCDSYRPGSTESPGSPFWVSNQGTSTATVYGVADKTTVRQVNIPPNGFVATASGPRGPTGQVNNANPSSFPVAHDDGQMARFIFAN